MAPSWDTNFKLFVAECPQAFAQWITGLANVTVTGRRPTEFPGREVDADMLLEMEVEGQSMLLHLEFQSTNDKSMGERLLEYSFRAKLDHEKVVYSCVIFLRRDGIVPEPPLCWAWPNGEPILWFQYRCIKLWELTPDDLPTGELPALLPLALLTKGGASRTIVEKVFTGLQAANLLNLCSFGSTLASLVLTQEADQQWLFRRYAQMKDILKDTPMYRHMTQDAHQDGLAEGMEKGLEQGMEKGLEKGLESLRKAIEGIVAHRFPALSKLAQQQMPLTSNPDLLQMLVIQISIATHEDEVKRYLLDSVQQKTA